MSINLSLKQIQHSDIVADVRDALADSGLPPQHLTLEITESVLMADTELAVQRLRELKALGVRLALDDFGTGYSSLSYLSRFPVDILKMDRSFLRDGASPEAARPGDRRRRRSAPRCRSRSSRRASRCPSSGTRLRELGCDLGQGFLFARPMDADASLAFLARAAQAARRCCHSYEGLDRAGGVARGGLLAPLRHRDFRLLWIGMCISLLGDGAFLVAIAWQVYELVDAPDGDVARRHRHDRADDRRSCSSAGWRATGLTGAGSCSRPTSRARSPVGTLAVLSLTGALELWHVVVLVVVYGTGQAFFAPAFDAIVPELVPAAQLPQANALDQIVRPARAAARRARARRRCWSARSAPARRSRSTPRPSWSPAPLLLACAAAHASRSPRASPCSATCARAGASSAAAVAVGDVRQRRDRLPAASWGRSRCCCRYVVKEELGGSATELGLVFAAGGLGSVRLRGAASAGAGCRGATSPSSTSSWTLATLAVAGYGLAAAVWQLMLASARLQRARDRRHDRLGHGEAAPRARRRCSGACRAWTG